jgi:hypothetical protein
VSASAPSLRLLATLAGACLALLNVAPRADAAGPGVVPDVTWGTSQSEIERTVALMQSAGVKSIRANVSWASLEPHAKGQFSSGYLAEMDRGIEPVLAAGIKVVMPLSDSVPYWASADPGKHESGSTRVWNKYYKPANMQDYADAFRFLAKHYAPKGVQVFEVWNEPNHSRFWPSGPNPGEYAQMLKAAYPAIKQVSPSATVLLGGLAQNDYGYLQGVYASGGGSSFDAVASHIYPKSAPELCAQESSGAKSRHSICGLEEVRRVMVANGDTSKSIWLTEMGYATCDNQAPECWDMGVSEQQQADYLLRAFWELESYPWVSAAFWYSFRNNYTRGDDSALFEATTGLLRTDFSEKPAFAAFRAYATGAAPRPATDPVDPVDPTATTVKVRRKGSPKRRAATVQTVRPHRIRVIGRVNGARDGAVKIEVDRRKRGRWRPAVRRRARVRASGRFVKPIRIGRRLVLGSLRDAVRGRKGRAADRRNWRAAGRRKGRAADRRNWRIRARYLGSRSRAASVSRYRYFRVG